METADGISLANLLVSVFGATGAILFGVWKMTESVRGDVRDNRSESTREHAELRADMDRRFDRVEADIDARFNAVDARFNLLDERDRRRLRAMLE